MILEEGLAERPTLTPRKDLEGPRPELLSLK